MELNTVKIRVEPFLKEFLIATADTDVLIPDKRSVLWCLLKQHLVTSTFNDVIDDDIPSEECVKIALRGGKVAPVYNLQAERPIHIDTFYRCYLNSASQAIINKHFEKHFKQVFRSFMTGFSCAVDDNKVSSAILDFCLLYRLTVNDTLVERLRKDWYRYRLKGKKNILLF